MTGSSTLIWLRQDLRIADNPALHAAVQRGASVILVYIHAPHEESTWQPGGASRWWLHHSLLSLDGELRKIGTLLVIRRGDTAKELKSLAREACADTVFWNRRYEPAAIAREEQATQALERAGIAVTTCNGALLFDPSAVLTRSGTPYKVFKPFYHACLAEVEPALPLPAPGAIPAPARWPDSLSLTQLKLEPETDRASGMRATWTPGCAGAMQQLEEFLAGALASYSQGRNRPDLAGTSHLSPHLHFGEISPRQVWQAAKEHLVTDRKVVHHGQARVKALTALDRMRADT